MRAFFSNRVLHLLGEIDFCKVTHDAMTCMENGAYFCVSARSPDDFNTALMEWIPGKEQEMARYKDPARGGHDITFVTKDRLLRAVENDLEDMHCTNATEPERVGSPDTHLLILLGRKRGWVSDAAMPTVGSNLAAETADGDGVETSRNCSKDAHLGLKSTRDASSALELSQFEHRRTSRSTGGRMSALERPDPTGMASLPARSDRAGLTASSLPQSPILSTLGAADGGQSLDAGADRVNAGAPHA